MMSTTRITRWLRPAAATALTCSAILAFASAPNEPAKATRVSPISQDAAPKIDKAVFGAGSCQKCHVAGAFVPNPPAQVKGNAPAATPLICLMDEYDVWAKQDKHSLAYEVLKGDRAQRIGHLVWNDQTDVTTKAECLSCHAMPAGNETGLRPGLSYNVAEGVTCVACHGAASSWVGLHIDPSKPDWKALTRQQKESLHGMTDLWDASTRAKVCASCHIGNKAEGKFLTHAMYAAGHPPLPGFEVETFSYAEPQHWRELRDKPANVRALQKFVDFNPLQSERARLLAVGQAAALRDAIALLADDASDKAKAEKPRDRALDLTHFDCYACHHELKYPGLRQSRGYTGSAGRPQPRPWPTALIPALIRVAHPDDEGFATALRDFEKALVTYLQPFEDRPFGRTAEVVTGAAPVREWLDTLVGRLNSAQYDEATVRAMLRDLTTIAQGESPAKEIFDTVDYDSAREIAWAFRVLYSEWKLLRDAAKKPTPASDERVGEIFTALQASLRLDLPSGVNRSITGEGSELPANLKAVADFDPASFRAAMTELDRLIETD